MVTNGGDNGQAIGGNPGPSGARNWQVSCASAHVTAGGAEARMSMVRRRSTVRFRKGAPIPGHRPNSSGCSKRLVMRSGDWW